MTGFHELRSRLFRKNPMPKPLARPAPRHAPRASSRCSATGAEAAVAAVKEALARNEPFAVVFLDMRMPPGPDGVWAAARIRELDPAVEIVMCTAYSDVDPCDIGGVRAAGGQAVVPAEAVSSARSAADDHRAGEQVARGTAHRARWRTSIPLTGLPNREQSRNRLRRRARDGQAATAGCWRCCTSISTTSSASTTPSATAVGDELLCVVAERLRNSLRYGDDSRRRSGAAARAPATSPPRRRRVHGASCRTCAAAPTTRQRWPSA